MSRPDDTRPPDFDDAFRQQLGALFRWRRDVRRFRTDPIDDAVIDRLLGLAALAPSVGNSQPWRFVKVNDPTRRAAIRASFEACNKDALADYHGERAKLYAQLKLEGLGKAPVQLAVFVDAETDVGRGLGQKTMPETLNYSVVAAINHLWLAARAESVGVGWVSILEPDRVNEALDVPGGWELVAHLCVGYPEEDYETPELVRAGWQDRLDISEFVIER